MKKSVVLHVISIIAILTLISGCGKKDINTIQNSDTSTKVEEVEKTSDILSIADLNEYIDTKLRDEEKSNIIIAELEKNASPEDFFYIGAHYLKENNIAEAINWFQQSADTGDLDPKIQNIDTQ